MGPEQPLSTCNLTLSFLLQPYWSCQCKSACRNNRLHVLEGPVFFFLEPMVPSSHFSYNFLEVRQHRPYTSECFPAPYGLPFDTAPSTTRRGGREGESIVWG